MEVLSDGHKMIYWGNSLPNINIGNDMINQKEIGRLQKERRKNFEETQTNAYFNRGPDLETD